MIFPCLSLLQCSSSSQIVITWFVNLVTAGGLIDYIVMCITFIFYHRACKAQGFDRKTLPYYGYFQPYCAWVALIWLIVVTCIYGYTVYLPWDVSSFFSNYAMQIFIPPLFIIWKLIKKTKFVHPLEADLVWEKPIVDAYEETFLDPPVGFWREMGRLVGLKKMQRGGSNRRRTSVIEVPVSMVNDSRAGGVEK